MPARYLGFGLLALVLLAACGDGGGGASTQSPTVTVTSSAIAGEGFRRFATEVEQALSSGDAGFFADNAVFLRLRCDAQFAPPAACSGQPSTTVVETMPLGILQSEGRGLDPAQYQRFMQEFLTNLTSSSVQDVYGGPQPMLYASGVLNRGVAQFSQDDGTIELIATRISGPRQADSQVPGPELARQPMSIGVTFLEGRWRITHLMTGPADYFLAGESAEAKELFTSWQRWQ